MIERLLIKLAKMKPHDGKPAPIAERSDASSEKRLTLLFVIKRFGQNQGAKMCTRLDFHESPMNRASLRSLCGLGKTLRES
jgi:hypothetical protein